MSVNAGQTIRSRSTPVDDLPHRHPAARLLRRRRRAQDRLGDAADGDAAADPAGLHDDSSTTGLVDCGNWAVSASWTVPSDAVSGVYIAHLVRDDDAGGDSQITFVVRNDASHSAIVVQTSDATWQAYNTYGGNSLYSCTVACPPGNPQAYKAAYKVSYNRPFARLERRRRRLATSTYAEYPMIRFLERNGYDVSYIAERDVDRSGSLLLNHKLFISSGHDEYWSGQQRSERRGRARRRRQPRVLQRQRDVLEDALGDRASTARTRPTARWSPTRRRTSTPRSIRRIRPTWTGTWARSALQPAGRRRRRRPTRSPARCSCVNSGTADDHGARARTRKLRIWRNTAAAEPGLGHRR